MLRQRVDVVLIAALRDDESLRLLTDVHAVAPELRFVGPDQFAEGAELRRWSGTDSLPWLFGVVAGLPADRIAPAWRPLMHAVDDDAYWPPYAVAATLAILDAIARSDGSRAGVAAALRTTALPDGPLGPIAFSRAGDVAAPPFTVVRLAPGGTGMDPERPDFADGTSVVRVLD